MHLPFSVDGTLSPLVDHLGAGPQQIDAAQPKSGMLKQGPVGAVRTPFMDRGFLNSDAGGHHTYL